jgi:hypothetical protein
MAHEETTSRDLLVNMAFSATFFLFIFNAYSIITRFLYLYSASWLPFLVIICIPLYPVLRRCMATTTILLLAFTCLAAGAMAKFILHHVNGMGSIFVMVDALALGNFAISVIVFCAFFDRRAELSSMASATTRGKENTFLVIGSLIVTASCFALGGSGVDSEALSAVLLVPIAITIVVAWRREKWQNGDRLETLLHDDKQLPFKNRIKAGYSLVSTVNDAMMQAVVIFFAGTMLIPYLNPFHECEIDCRPSSEDALYWDATTWRFIAMLIFSVLAMLLLVWRFRSKKSDARKIKTPVKFDFYEFIWLMILGFSSLLWDSLVILPDITITRSQEVVTPAGITIIIMLLVQGIQFARVKSGARVDAKVSMLQCLRAGMVAGVLLGIGAPALMLFVRVGMNFDAWLYTIIAVAASMAFELPLMGRKHRRK